MIWRVRRGEEATLGAMVGGECLGLLYWILGWEGESLVGKGTYLAG